MKSPGVDPKVYRVNLQCPREDVEQASMNVPENRVGSVLSILTNDDEGKQEPSQKDRIVLTLSANILGPNALTFMLQPTPQFLQLTLLRNIPSLHTDILAPHTSRDNANMLSTRQTRRWHDSSSRRPREGNKVRKRLE